MARTPKASTKAAVLEDEAVETETAEQTPKQVINGGILTVAERTGIDLKVSRYKAARILAYQALLTVIDEGGFDQLVEDALANHEEFPSGWDLGTVAKAAPAPKAKTPAKRAPKAAAAEEEATPAPAKRTRKAAAAPAADAPKRRRPTR